MAKNKNKANGEPNGEPNGEVVDLDDNETEVEVTSTDAFIIKDKDGNHIVTIARADLSDKTQFALTHRALAHIFRNESTSAVGAQKKKPVKDGESPVNLDTFRADWIAKKAQSLRDGTLGIREGVARLSPMDKAVKSIVEAGLKRRATANNVKLPTVAAEYKVIYDAYLDTNRADVMRRAAIIVEALSDMPAV